MCKDLLFRISRHVLFKYGKIPLSSPSGHDFDKSFGAFADAIQLPFLHSFSFPQIVPSNGEVSTQRASLTPQYNLVQTRDKSTQ